MSKRLFHSLVLAGLFALILGAKFTDIDRSGSDLPEWDQWDAEGLHIYLPWAEHHLGPGDFLRPHNEHRVVLTKLLGLAELLVNGQWDARLQTAVNAGLHTALAVLVFLFGRRHLAARWHPAVFLLVAALFGLPLAWQNLLGGFHSQQYFLLGLSFAAIVLLPAAAPWTRDWWTGAVCAGLALFSMGSGVFAAAAIVAVAALALRRRATSWRQTAPALIVCGGLLAAALATRVTVDYHESLKAKNLHDFALYLRHSLQWPSPDAGWLAALFWLPWIWLTWRLTRARTGAAGDPFGPALFGLGVWVLLQIFASAYARGAGGGMPASRYVDTLAFGLIVNGLAWGWLWQQGQLTPAARRVALGLAGVWALALAHGLLAQSRRAGGAMAEVAQYHRNCERSTRHYLATGDATGLRDSDVPYPSVSSFLVRIDLPYLRRIQPVSVRRPITLETTTPAAPFVLHDPTPRPAASFSSAAPTVARTGVSPATPALENTRTWGSYGLVGRGEWVSVPAHLERGAYLRFMVAGAAGREGVRLVVRDARTGEEVAKVQPDHPPGDAWRRVHVWVPAGNFVVAASIDAPDRWLAFSEPAEMPFFSYWIAQAVHRGRWLIVAGVALSLAGCLGLWFIRRTV